MSIRAFAEHLGVAARTVAKWEKLGVATRPRPDTQVILDTALARADASARLRFEALLAEAGRQVSTPRHHRVHATNPRTCDLETWADPATRDEGLAVLDRTAALAARYGLAHQLRSIEDIRARSARAGDGNHRETT